MTKVIIHGCNGKMGQMITRIIESDPEIEAVAGVDASDHIKNTYPVFKDIAACDIEADAVISVLRLRLTDFLISAWKSRFRVSCVQRGFRRHSLHTWRRLPKRSPYSSRRICRSA